MCEPNGTWELLDIAPSQHADPLTAWMLAQRKPRLSYRGVAVEVALCDDDQVVPLGGPALVCERVLTARLLGGAGDQSMTSPVAVARRTWESDPYPIYRQETDELTQAVDHTHTEQILRLVLTEVARDIDAHLDGVDSSSARPR